MATLETLEEKVRLLTESLNALRMASTVAPSSAAPEPSVLSPSLLTSRSFLPEIQALVHPPSLITGKSATEESTSTQRLRPPPQPRFDGSGYRLFLQRYRRWSLLSWIDDEPDEVKRSWFVSAMGDRVLPIVEAILERTSFYEELIEQVGAVYPVLVNDFTLRNDLDKIPVLKPPCTMESLEGLLVETEGVWCLMTPDSLSDQERIVCIVKKLPSPTWQAMREHPVWKYKITTWKEFVIGLRGLVAELQSNEALAQLASPSLPMMALPEGESVRPKYRGKPDQSKGVSFRGTVSCHF